VWRSNGTGVRWVMNEWKGGAVRPLEKGVISSIVMDSRLRRFTFD